MGGKIEAVSVVDVVVGRLTTPRESGAEVLNVLVEELSVDDVSLMICARTILLPSGLEDELR
jgi:hypothetical protein